MAKRHYVFYAKEKERWPCWCPAGTDHDSTNPEFIKSAEEAVRYYDLPKDHGDG